MVAQLFSKAKYSLLHYIFSDVSISLQTAQ